MSIWINQAIKGFRDKDGRQVENAHLLGLFNRVCKLLFYKIKPIFVFDGECPTLKLHTVHRRSERARKVLEKSKNLSLNVIEKFVNSQLAKSSKLVFNTAKLSSSAKNFLSEFYLPPSRQVDIYQNFVQLEEQFQNKISDEPIAEEGDVLVSKTFHHPDYQNVRDIDINSAHFKRFVTILLKVSFFFFIFLVVVYHQQHGMKFWSKFVIATNNARVQTSTCCLPIRMNFQIFN